MQRFSRWMRVSVVPFYGRWWLPIPYRVPLIALQVRIIYTSWDYVCVYLITRLRSFGGGDGSVHL